jgi:hypothetical protein
MTTPRRTLGEILTILENDMAQHLTSGAASDEELAGLEAALGHPLPESYKALLGLMGGGLYYDRHEIFGPHIVMIHDIEMVPSLLTMRLRLRAELRSHAGFLPLHADGTRVHLIDVSDPEGAAPVVALDGSGHYPDLAAFLEAVVLPAAAAAR